MLTLQPKVVQKPLKTEWCFQSEDAASQAQYPVPLRGNGLR